jgi:uncharacterized C2H2 Zn-finger protein
MNSTKKTCVECGHSVASGKFARHVASHQPLIACQYCAALFTRRDNYQRHLQSHNDNEGIQCYKCCMTFTRQDNYIRHLKLHGDENAWTQEKEKQVQEDLRMSDDDD